ncbi:MAG TPA: hypothetical protein VGR35_09685 [Tepidisphaeraceae bacterium]|nr:hypothetical protein [Tepidisphaeraceae bacterium]
MCTGVWTHDYPITVEQARQLGLSISTPVPEDLYLLMALYPQPRQGRPSVEYLPAPYERPDTSRPPGERPRSCDGGIRVQKSQGT